MQIGNYKLTHEVGSGGMGTVFRALDASGKPVALKMIGSKALIDATIHAKVGAAAQRPPALDISRRMMFVREARVAMELHHPHITRVFDYGQHEGLLYIVMEFLSGRPLDKVIPLYAAISLSTRIALVRQLCQALGYAHQQGIIHRDIKPPNCFVIDDSLLKVLDFGIAERAGHGQSQALLMGTTSHMAPELFAQPPQYSESSDIWAAGVTFYQLLTGRLPFTGSSLMDLVKKVTRMPFEPLSESLPCAMEFERILDRALAKDPGSRYAAVGDFESDLASVEAALIARNDSLSEDEKQSGSSVWWSRGISKGTALTSPVPVSTVPKIAPVSGEIRARRGGQMVRFAEYNARILGPQLICTLLAWSYAIFSMLGGDGNASWKAWAWMAVAYVSGFLVPVFLLISAVLFGHAFLAKLDEVSRCRRCRAILRHRSRVTAYAYSRLSWRHASSDCLGALVENLWDDAPKLLAMHGELVAPALDSKTAYPPLRLHLDFYSCRCGDQFAALTTEDRIGYTWNTREEFEGAYKTEAIPEPGPSIFGRSAGLISAVARSVRLAAEPLPPRLTALVIAAGLLTAFEYWPQYPIILDKKNPVTLIQSDPPGVGFTLGTWSTYNFTSPRSFLWAYRTTHVIICDDTFIDSKKVYKFNGVTPKPDRIETYRSGFGRSTLHDVFISVEVKKDRWGRLTAQAATPAYTIQYKVVGTRDFIAEARAEAKADELRKHTNTPNAPNRGIGAATRARIVVTSKPEGLAVLVDGVRIVTPRSYDWQVGSSHVLIVLNGRQALNESDAAAGRFYTDGHWDYGTLSSPSYTRINWSAIPFPYTYTATFWAAPKPEPQAKHSSADK